MRTTIQEFAAYIGIDSVDQKDDISLSTSNYALKRKAATRIDGRYDMASIRQNLELIWRHYLRQEPGAIVPLDGIFAGGAR